MQSVFGILEEVANAACACVAVHAGGVAARFLAATKRQTKVEGRECALRCGADLKRNLGVGRTDGGGMHVPRSGAQQILSCAATSNQIRAPSLSLELMLQVAAPCTSCAAARSDWELRHTEAFAGRCTRCQKLYEKGNYCPVCNQARPRLLQVLKTC